MREIEFQDFCLAIVDRMTPVREQYTPFPRYFEVTALNFLVMRNLLRDLYPLDRRYGLILEVGCGVGVHSALLSRFCDRLFGIDIPGEYAGYVQPEFKSSADMARSVNEHLGTPNAEFVDAFPDKIPLSTARVDMVFSWTMLEHVPELPPTYKEMLRVLKPGGVMIHIVPNVMSAVDTMMRVNIGAAAVKSPTFAIPEFHSEFLRGRGLD
jgi:SAM-dependent methyltransferase